jgi:hypothetical protein
VINWQRRGEKKKEKRKGKKMVGRKDRRGISNGNKWSEKEKKWSEKDSKVNECFLFMSFKYFLHSFFYSVFLFSFSFFFFFLQSFPCYFWPFSPFLPVNLSSSCSFSSFSLCNSKVLYYSAIRTSKQFSLLYLLMSLIIKKSK